MSVTRPAHDERLAASMPASKKRQSTVSNRSMIGVMVFSMKAERASRDLLSHSGRAVSSSQRCISGISYDL